MPNICKNALKIEARSEDMSAILGDIFGREISKDDDEIQINPTILIPYPELFEEFRQWEAQNPIRERIDESQATRASILARDIAAHAYYSGIVELRPEVDPHVLNLLGAMFPSMNITPEIMSRFYHEFQRKASLSELTQWVEQYLVQRQQMVASVASWVSQMLYYILAIGAFDEVGLRNAIHGTKWMSGGPVDYWPSQKIFFHYFNSAWVPPHRWFQVLVKKYPAANFYLRAVEPGNLVDILYVGELARVQEVNGETFIQEDQDGELLPETEYHRFNKEDFDRFVDPEKAMNALELIGNVELV